MKRIWFILIYLAVTGLCGCLTDDGMVPLSDPGNGSIVVSESQSLQAQIFLDYENTGLTTPAVLSGIPAGGHVVHVFLADHASVPDSKFVEIEDGKQYDVQFTLDKRPSGDLKITTSPDSVRVRINGLNFGASPATISGLVEGSYGVSLSRSGYGVKRRTVNIPANQLVEINESLLPQKMVLLEHFSNSGCAPCPDADEIIETVLTEIGTANVASIGYHPYFPSNDDPMYLATKAETDLRYGNSSGSLGYYGVQQPLPYVIADGGERFVGLAEITENNVAGAIDARSALQPVAICSIPSFVRNDSVVYGSVLIEALSDLGSNTVLRIAAIEREIVFPQPPGTNGQSRFIDVFRGFYPDPGGIPVTLSAGQEALQTFSFPVRSEWLVTEIEIVAFLQDDDTRLILQAAWTVLF